MEGAGENSDKFNRSARMNGFPGDSPQKVTNKTRFPKGSEAKEEEDEKTDEEIELSLGLSMNGRFGVDPARKKLRRSSSISNLVFTVGSSDGGGSSRLAREVSYDTYAPLMRTCSLPTEAEDEWRRRKELQSMRRMEARKKRMEKLKQVRVVKDKDNSSEDGNGLHEAVDDGGVSVRKLENEIHTGIENGNVMPSPQGSIGSQKSSSSGNFSEFQSQHVEEPKQNAEAKSPATVRSVGNPIERSPAAAKASSDRNAGKGNNDLLKTTFLDMPYVSTKGDGPNSHRIEGFLYRYRKGEEVRIVCVCHGLFLSPAEFVKHGGGGDVEHPLKHIVVNPSPLF